jgi:hypothetical protein
MKLIDILKEIQVTPKKPVLKFLEPGEEGNDIYYYPQLGEKIKFRLIKFENGNLSCYVFPDYEQLKTTKEFLDKLNIKYNLNNYPGEKECYFYIENIRKYFKLEN